MVDLSTKQREDLEAVLDTSAGRRMMHWLVYDVCRIEDGTFHDKVHDGLNQSQHQNIREGQRDVAIELQQTFKSTKALALLWVRAKQEANEQCVEEITAPPQRKGK